MSFTDFDLRALESRNFKYRISAGDGLYVEVQPNGLKSFGFLYHFPPGSGGEQKWHLIGHYVEGTSGMTLAQARHECQKLNLHVSRCLQPQPSL